MAMRVLFAVLCCPPLGFGSAVVTELFFSHERAQKMGWWTVMITLGIPLGPIIMGVVVEHVGVDWIFGICAIINFCQFLGYLVFGAETLYDRSSSSTTSAPPRRGGERFSFRRLNNKPFTFEDFYGPLALCRFPAVTLPAIAHALVFSYGNTAITVELPSQFAQLFHFNAQQIGLQYISVVIGAVLGEQLAGPLSDMFMNRSAKRTGRHDPAHRLWIAYIGFITTIVGVIVWGTQLQKVSDVPKVRSFVRHSGRDPI
jgi:MFS family permease